MSHVVLIEPKMLFNRVIAYRTCNYAAVYDPKFNQFVKCVGHTGPVCAVDAIHLDNNKLLIASTASDSTVKLCLYTGSKVECTQTISFGSGFMMDVSLAFLPGSRVLILACCGEIAESICMCSAMDSPPTKGMRIGSVVWSGCM
uniref:Uncharacterized protein n=1 Tax=Hucho hucho TaxID=62062 RepID=A0A4W5P6V4_9TELE